MSGDVTVFLDADGSHDPQDIPKLVQPLVEGSSDLVVGSRFSGGSDEFVHKRLDGLCALLRRADGLVEKQRRHEIARHHAGKLRLIVEPAGGLAVSHER